MTRSDLEHLARQAATNNGLSLADQLDRVATHHAQDADQTLDIQVAYSARTMAMDASEAATALRARTFDPTNLSLGALVVVAHEIRRYVSYRKPEKEPAMTTFTFVARDRKKNSNEPLTYDITKPSTSGKTQTSAGTLVKQKNKWRLRWLGIAAEFDTKHQLCTHLRVLGHQVVGLA